MKPRIFIGAPVYDKVSAQVLEDWMRFAYHLGRRMPEYDFFLGIKPKSEQFRARNDIVTGALQVNADWLLMLDDDMLIDVFGTTGRAGEGDSSFDFLRKLIAHDKDICGVRYYQRGGNFEPVLMRKLSEGYRFLREDEIEEGLQQVDVVGGGCMLINMRIFNRLQPPYFAPEFKYGTDIQICKKAAEAGYTVWADTSIELGHVKMEATIVTSRNRKRLQLDNAVPGEVQRGLITADVFTRLLEDACEYTGIAPSDPAWKHGGDFMLQHQNFAGTDADWYRLYPNERIARQVWFNSDCPPKRQMTEYILQVVTAQPPSRILEFGCGIGILAFELARAGHDVTALDIKGTGTLEFLKWRAAKHGLNINIIESEGGPPQLQGKWDFVIAMDSIEHVEDWRGTLGVLADHVRVDGVFFSNNAILEDDWHPEHYHIDSKEFISLCMAHGLMPFNQITYSKKETVHAENTNPVAHVAV